MDKFTKEVRSEATSLHIHPALGYRIVGVLPCATQGMWIRRVAL